VKLKMVDSVTAGEGATPDLQVFELVKKQDVEGLRRVLRDDSFSPNVYDVDGMTPLQHAAYRGNLELCQLLLDRVSACLNR
jgi:ankyrin repeat protein